MTSQYSLRDITAERDGYYEEAEGIHRRSSTVARRGLVRHGLPGRFVLSLLGLSLLFQASWKPLYANFTAAYT